MQAAASQSEIFATAMNIISASLGQPLASQASPPLLYGANNQPLAPSMPQYGIQRTAAKRSGSMKKWIPRRVIGQQQEALEREAMVDRSTDLVNNDPHAAGVVDLFATTVIGPGLTPHYSLDPEDLALDQEQVRIVQRQMRNNLRTWSTFADAAGRLTFGSIQHLIKRNLFQYGEYLVLLPMLKDPGRPFSLACQVLHPLRLKTPLDLLNRPDIRDGVELGEYGEARAYWIKKTDGRNARLLNDTSANFIRIEARHGHRWRVLHGFIQKDAEQVRGVPEFAPGMKMFRDLNDYLDAELVSNIVTAAFSMFVETTGDQYALANQLATFSETGTVNGQSKTDRYQEMQPGQIMYGGPGEKPHPISAARPGATFEPFTKVIKKAIAVSCNIPYPVLWRDVEGVSFAGFRSAMLEAWRVFSCHRQWMGSGFCQPVNTMLQEEAFLRGKLDIPDFYERMWDLTAAEWVGPPKGDIEPIKAVQADLMAINGNLKTRQAAIAERGGDYRRVFDDLAVEKGILKEKDLYEDPAKVPPRAASPDRPADEGAVILARLDEVVSMIEEQRDE